MDKGSVISVCFSPTGTTRRVVEGIVAGMQAEKPVMIDITKKAHRDGGAYQFKGELAVIAAPVYYGRIPEAAAGYFNSLTGDNTPAVIVVVYGNRAYDDALIELYDIAVKRGFVPVAAGAFIGEHSYSTEMLPAAAGRPDVKDIEAARAFGDAVREKLLRCGSVREVLLTGVPGKRPYIDPEGLHRLREIRKTVQFTPETDELLCTRCNCCVEACPEGAIDQVNILKTDNRECIMCFACVKACPINARRMAEPAFFLRVKEIFEKCRERKEPEWYL
jgi:ferredoxin